MRHHGDLARIEIAREDLPRALSIQILDLISAQVRAAGFRFVALDTEGYRSGSMNEALHPAETVTVPLTAITRAPATGR